VNAGGVDGVVVVMAVPSLARVDPSLARVDAVTLGTLPRDHITLRG
jgi:hypothetical protein